MITNVIRWSVENRIMVLVMAVFLAVWGIISVQQTPVDALPDLSDVQVIIKTSYPGQAPQVVEDQVTYPLTIAMLSVPKAVTVRAYSFFGDSYVYVIFEDGTDLYWARSRVLAGRRHNRSDRSQQSGRSHGRGGTQPTATRCRYRRLRQLRRRYGAPHSRSSGRLDRKTRTQCEWRIGEERPAAF